MYLIENPVLQRELLVNLRMTRAFVLLFLYQALLGLVVYLAWPQETHLDLAGNPEEPRRLVNLFFLGQYILASLMAPSFASGTLTGEKEHKTYEMLLASPLRPGAIVLGKLLASLAHLLILIFSSLPIVMLCLPLGGVSLYEVLAAYLGLILSVVTFGVISIACSSYFSRRSSSLAVSYLVILPMALLGVLLWTWLEDVGQFRLLLMVTVLPAACFGVCLVLLLQTSRRLLYPPDVGSEGKEVVDIEEESRQAVGLVINRDQFPDFLFAPPKRTDLLADGTNPIYDKEIHSEIFAQGTLMLRVVVQVSVVLAIPLMAFLLFIYPQYAPWYISYVIGFNMLIGPVFSAGSVCSERERQTLDLLLTTTITPWQILWGKFIAGLRVSSVLTAFLLWPVLLACALVNAYWRNLPAMLLYLLIVVLTCVTTANIALFCSVLFHKTSQAMMTTYLVIMALFCVPLAASYFADTFLISGDDFHLHVRLDKLSRAGESDADLAARLRAGAISSTRRGYEWTADDVAELRRKAELVGAVHQLGATSPFAASFAVPLEIEFLRNFDDLPQGDSRRLGSPRLLISYLALTLLLNAGLIGIMIWLFNTRWRVAE